MTDLAPQRIGEFLRVVFARLWQEPSGLPAGEVLAHVHEAIRLSDYESGCAPSTNIPRYEKLIRLATIPLVRAGWMVKSKGRWYLTEEGRRACKSFANPDDFYKEALRLFENWRQSRSSLSLATEDAEEMAWEQVRRYLLGMRPYEFQDLVGDLLLAMGYHIAWIAPPGKDRGYVNFVVYPDSLGVGRPRIKIHVLHNGQPAMLEGFKSFASILGVEDAGMYISTGGFSSSVIEEAQQRTDSRIVLVDLENFFDLWVEYYDKLTLEARQRLPLKPIYFLSLLG